MSSQVESGNPGTLDLMPGHALLPDSRVGNIRVILGGGGEGGEGGGEGGGERQ